jgi:hypothetical protein
MPLDVGITKCGALALLDARQQGLQSIFDISHQTPGYRVAPPNVRGIGVDLDEKCRLPGPQLPATAVRRSISSFRGGWST